MITGFSGAAGLTLVFFFLPVVLAIWLLRISRPATNRNSADRISLVLAGILGFVFLGRNDYRPGNVVACCGDTGPIFANK